MRVIVTAATTFQKGDRLALTPDQARPRAYCCRGTGYRVGRHLVEVEATGPVFFKPGERVTILHLAASAPDGLRPRNLVWRPLWWMRDLAPPLYACRAALRRWRIALSRPLRRRKGTA